MKRTLFPFLLALLTPFLYTSCYVDLDIEAQRPTPSIVLNSVISTDEAAAAHIGKTVFYTERYRTPQPIKDATVVMNINDAAPQTLSWTSNDPENPKADGLYRSNYVAKAGDKIRLEITNASGQQAWAEDIMPQKTPIEKVETSLAPEVIDYGQNMHYRITFTDEPGKKNFYFLHISSPNGSNNEFDFGREDVFRRNQKGLDALAEENTVDGRYGMAFSDELIDGKTYTLHVTERVYPTMLEYRVTRIIRLYTITEAYYRYLLGIFNKNEDSFDEGMIEAGLAEPSPHYTNVQGGVGIFGLMQIDEKTINIGADIPREWAY